MTANTVTPLESLAQKIARQQAELEALQREYETRQSTLVELNRQKAELKAQLQQINADIRAMREGGPSAAPSQAASTTQPAAPRTQARPQTGKAAAATLRAPRVSTLSSLLLDILQDAGVPRTVKQLSEEVVRRDFKTTSKNIPAIVKEKVYALVRRHLLRRVSRKNGYALAKGAAKTPAKQALPPSRPTAQNGSVAKKIPPSRDGQKQQLPLRTLLTNLLAKSRRPLTARELADQVLASGYQTKSKNFMEVMWVALSQMKNIKKVPDKGYILKR
jgi:hypothetical protein